MTWKISTRHGFRADAQYQLPEHVQLRPTSVASEFAGITNEGASAVSIACLMPRRQRRADRDRRGAGRPRRALPWRRDRHRSGGRVRRQRHRPARRPRHPLGVEAGTFTALSRVAQTAINPEQMADASLWTPKSLLSEFLQNYAVIGVLQLKGFGQAQRRWRRSARWRRASCWWSLPGFDPQW